MYSTTDFKKGLRIEFEKEPFEIIDFQHVKPGKGGAFVRTKLKNLINGRVIDRTLRAGEKVETPNIEEKNMQYLYAEGDEYVFMDNETYDQIKFSKETVGDNEGFLLENITVNVLYYNNKPINIDVPNFLDLKIASTEPGIKGDTVSGATKPAVLETKLVINVPLFINEGDVIKVDTRNKSYIERVSK
ncbi:MAG: elongation factor P [Candidatus Acididesulfobacter diazotrophicus]|uniref:Elongation factor P n=1 Tax=Candidatus Acididesulfobacter diazotrophicus TaxID=2597226 RepID=A0A519BKV0_9DELT|nr:MAG: elongation factor P [Candidatus Acididesulfobacter diazotrophicus]